MLIRVVRLSLASLVLSLACLPVSLAEDPASQQLREQRQALELLERQQRLKRWERQAPAGKPIHDNPPDGAGDPCLPVSGVRLAGNRRLSERQLEPTVRPLLHACMGVAAINRLLRGLTERYVQAGYPLVRPYLREMPRAGQPLDILIVEGHVESIGLSQDLPLSLRGAFPDLLGQPLYLPDLEQGLDQLNRLRAFDLTADLLPGHAPGSTQVAIVPRQTDKRWHLDGRFDNRGNALTGRHRLNLGLGVDSPLTLNDDLRLSLSATLLDAPGESRGVHLYYSLPYGPWTFTLNASQLTYHSALPGGYQASGTSHLQGASAERVLWRNQQGLLSANLRLDRKQLENAVNHSIQTVQSTSLTTLDAGLNLLWLEQGLWSVSLGLSQGLDALGADHRLAVRHAPQTAFRKYRASLLYLAQAPPDQTWRWQSELSLQYSPDVLPPIEQLLLTDNTSVRGIRQHQVSSDSGAIWRNTLSYPLAPFPSTAVQLSPFLGLDIGWARQEHDLPSRRLVGSAIGLELSLPGNRVRLDYQRALYASDHQKHSLEPGYWGLEWTLEL
jgi:hemolysin activation/secretion protein